MPVAAVGRGGGAGMVGSVWEQRAWRQQRKTPGEGDGPPGGGKLPCKPLSGERVLWGLQVAG